MTTSWVIRDKISGKALFETFNAAVVEAINKDKYEVVPIAEYLAQVNRQIKNKQ